MSNEKKPVPDFLSSKGNKSKKSPEEDYPAMLTSLVPALLWRADPTGTDISLNRQWEEYTGQSTEETQAWGWLKAIHPEDLDRVARTFRKAFEKGEPIELEQRIRSSSGAYRWFQVRHRPVRDAEGRITAWFGAAIDIEERKQAEEALRASEQRFASLFAASPVPSMVLKPDAPDFTITAANAAYYAATLTTPETLIGRRLFDVFPDDHSRPGQLGSKALAISLDSVLSTKRSDTMKRVRYDILTPDGRFEPHWWEATNAPMLDAAGNVTAIIHQVARVTELHLAEQVLRQKEEKYRTQLERDVHDRTVELDANKELLQATMDASMDMIQVFKAVRNGNGEIVDFIWILNNAASKKIYGDVIGKSLLKNNPGVVDEGIFDTFKQVVETGVPNQSERHYVHEQFDGWFYQSAVKLSDGVATTTTNITVRKKAEQQILHLKDEIAQRATDKYELLFNSIDEGFGVIEMLYNEEGKPIDYFFHEVNSAYEGLTGQINPSGKLGSEVSPHIEPYWLDAYDKVVQTGESIRHETYHGDTDRWYATFASRMGTEGSRMLAIVFDDITERKQQEQRQQYLLKLNDILRLTAYAAEIEGKITAHAMEYFGAGRCCYCVIEDGYAITLRDARNPGLPSVAGSYPLSEHPVLQTVLDNLLPFIVKDVSTSTILDASLKELCLGLNIISFIVVPVVKNNTLTGAICLAQATPRFWKEAEINLLFVTAERAWAEIERAKAEEALKASQKRFRSIANLVPDLLWDSEPDGSTNWYNQRWLEYTGQNFEQAIGWGWLDAIHPDDREGSAKRYREAVEAGMPLRQEHRIRRYDGEYRWFVVNASPLKDESGQVVKMYGSATDIHDTKKAEVALRESEEKYRTLFNSMEEGFTIIDVIFNEKDEPVDYRFVEANPAFVKHTALENAIGKTVTSFAPNHEEFWFEIYGDIAKTGASKRFEHFASQINGGVWYDVYAFRLDSFIQHRIAVFFKDITERKIADEALQKSEERYRSLVEASEAIVWVLDHEGRAVREMPRWGAFTGLSFDEYKDFGYADATHPDDYAAVMNKWANAVAEQKAFGQEFRLRHRDGGYRRVSVRAVPVRDQGGEVQEWVGTIVDIQDQYEAEQALRENEEQFRTLADAVPQVMWSNDGKGVANYFNRRWYEYSGLSFEQSVGLGWEAIVHPEDALASKEKWHTALAAGEVFDTEYRLRRYDGVYRWHIGRNVPLKDREQRVTGWFGTATDIEELKQAQTALYYSEERYRIALASAKMAAWDWNISEDRIQWNDQHYYLFGIEPDGKEKKAADFARFVHPQDKALVESALKEATEVSGVYKAEFRIIRADGEVCWMSGYGRVVEFQDGKATRMTGVMYDITKQQLFTRELERLVRERTLELQQSNESLQQFATIAAHDLQEPLRKMRLFVSTVLRFKELLPPKGQESLEKLTATSERMSRLIQEVLQYSKVMARDRKFTPTDLDRVIRNILTDLELKIEETGAGIFYTDALPTIEAVSPQMNQLFYNLLTNALKYRRQDISLVIQIESRPLSLDELSTYPHLLMGKVYQKISISDNGIGFEPMYAEQIFQLFERLHPADEYEGTGVGLALCKKIVENHHGHIFAESMEGEGATFYVILPLKQ